MPHERQRVAVPVLPRDRTQAPAKARARDVLTFGSLFAGIGGFDLGLERAGDG